MERAEKMEHAVPERYRNRLFTFKAGGYDGCIWHPAAVLVTWNGDVDLVGSDGGAGGLDAEEWYRKQMRRYLDDRGVATSTDLRGEGAFAEYLKFREQKEAERRDLERERVAGALESEVGEGRTYGWDHEFCEYDVSTPEAVRSTCREMALVFYDVSYRAAIADALKRRGYKGAGVLCTECGRYVEDTGGFECFASLVDENSYEGIGGLAIAYRRLLCPDCCERATCPVCFGQTMPLTQEHERLIPYGERFVMRLAGVCSNCAYNLIAAHDRAVEENSARMTHLRFPLEPLLKGLEGEAVSGADAFDPTLAKSFCKYAEHQRSEGVPEPEIREAIADQVLVAANDTFGMVTANFREGIVEAALASVVDDYFDGQVEALPRDIEGEWRRLLGE